MIGFRDGPGIGFRDQSNTETEKEIAMDKLEKHRSRIMVYCRRIAGVLEKNSWCTGEG